MTNNTPSSSEADLVRDPDTHGRVLASGDWTLANVQTLSARINTLQQQTSALDTSAVSRLDASGAWLLEQLLCHTGQDAADTGLSEQWCKVLEAVNVDCNEERRSEPAAPPLWQQLLASIGRRTVGVIRGVTEMLSFTGLVVHRLGLTMLNPGRLRLTSTVYHMQQTGLNAVPLLFLLASLTGAVVAYLGATVLSDFGAELFIIDLVTFAFLREFGVLLTAILLAGRTASAFCAQIGMMKTREELDAIKVLGLDETEVLVVPRLLALIIVMPLLAFIATIAGLFGGLMVAVLALDIDLSLFFERMAQTVTLKHYLVGMLKAPVFALVIALIGCLEGLRVKGTARSVGEHTTSAVVKSLTTVIVLDGLAAIYFMEIGW
ncbi:MULTISPECIES: MlaE family ABC transporter permease [unclassified Arsukibacterium]|uniref:MlaE family ABC transporter permease n=1 Tax=unclassified Arsukibacterium TaxID=2635278 RepID=UPI000C439DDF|nr:MULTISPECIES: ABC transporter permease [unclassified Arsukibacterium]MBM35174.1 ABC transporter permease [Rheinheimera sp.]HAW94109.1 ABC transporter permease [Candidatus Azambacteria bacterium]|tara:strand:+ start:13060 stop:14190 length:1131 start_codon:yes stop_codon:yes gene_type:complete